MLAQTRIKAIVFAAAAFSVAAIAGAQQPARSDGEGGRVTGLWQVTLFNPVPGSHCPVSGWNVRLTEAPDSDVDGTYAIHCGSVTIHGEIIAHRDGGVIRGIYRSQTNAYGRVRFTLRPGGQIEGQGHRSAEPHTFQWNMVRMP
jgi:hypothetical protein